jgi:hypothetical protein
MLKALTKELNSQLIGMANKNKLLINHQQQKVMRFDFTPEKIMTLLSKKKLVQLERKWEMIDESGLDVNQFIELMVKYIPTANDDEKYELVYGCLKLFS